jgi:hypothetical protein
VRLPFLVGSGVSLDADLPSVGTITQHVLSGEGVFLGNDALYHRDPANPNYARLRPAAEPGIAFVRQLSALAHEYYDTLVGPGQDVDYEELAFLAAQVARSLSMAQENPAVFNFAQRLAIAAEDDLSAVSEISLSAYGYIRDVTRGLLDKPPARIDHLQALIDACSAADNVDLFTLNHDLVLEQALEAGGVAFSDGFEQVYGDLRIWSDTFTTGSVRLMKLHGSLSWWGFSLPGEDWRGPVTARVTNGDAFHARGEDHRILSVPHDMRPLFLVGTFDKIFGYETWIFPDQHFRFQEALRAADRLVVVGYGFRDQAINSRLIGWMSRSSDNRIIVIHGNPAQIPQQSRVAIGRNHWERWVGEGRLRIVRSWIAETSWDAIAAEL